MGSSLIKKAIDKKIIAIKLVNLRDFGLGKHKKVDDAPYGGGAGMVIRVDIIDKAISKLKFPAGEQNLKLHSILLDPKGKIFDQTEAQRLAQLKKPILLICGRYEGFDARVDNLVDEKISLGRFILNGGEVAAMALIEATARLTPGFLGQPQSLKDETFSQGRNLKYPQYTRPAEYQGQKVPTELISGHHQKIDSWRKTK